MYYNIVIPQDFLQQADHLWVFSLIFIYFLVVITCSNYTFTSDHIHSKASRRITYVL